MNSAARLRCRPSWQRPNSALLDEAFLVLCAGRRLADRPLPARAAAAGFTTGCEDLAASVEPEELRGDGGASVNRRSTAKPIAARDRARTGTPGSRMLGFQPGIWRSVVALRARQSLSWLVVIWESWLAQRRAQNAG